MKILGLTGIAGSGKTTLSNQLVDFGYKQTKFAEPLKLMLAQLLTYQGVNNDTAWRMVDGDLKEIPTSYLNNRTPRHAMQTLGFEWRNLIDLNLWVDVWKRKLFSYPSNAKIVVDDVRFLHEAEAVRSMGGRIIRIIRPRLEAITSSSHISETEMKQIIPDFIITNNGTPELMFAELKLFVDI